LCHPPGVKKSFNSKERLLRPLRTNSSKNKISRENSKLQISPACERLSRES